MPRNVEIKARVSDLSAVIKKAAELSGDKDGAVIKQRDTFFNVPNGRLKLRYLQGQGSAF
jgi:adenylate cyclase class IV